MEAIKFICILFLTILPLVHSVNTINDLPLVINTWAFTSATNEAWSVLNQKNSTSLDALVAGCSRCELDQCDGTVGYGGSPDEHAETTLDAMIMDGNTMNMGSVANLRQIKNAIKVARHVLENTQHSILAGDQASDFAVEMGFTKESLTTPKSKNIWKLWKQNNCQPNFWQNVSPNPEKMCGPYQPVCVDKNKFKKSLFDKFKFGRWNHDTIGMIVIDKNGKIFAGTSSNGAKHKIPGRVGDSPIPGAGAYATDIGAAVATGDGDVMMRFLPTFTAVENLRNGLSPNDAVKDAINRILKYYPKFVGAVIVASIEGKYSAACANMVKFPYSVVKGSSDQNVKIEYVNCS